MTTITLIALGSKNAAKMKAAQSAVRAYWGDAATVVGHDVPSGVADQPLTHEETQQGAINRARAALKAEPNAQIGIGMEGGVVEMAGWPVLMGYIAATDGDKTVVVPTTGITLPQAWGTALKNGAELRPLVIAAGLPYDYEGGTPSILTNGEYKRDAMFTGATLTALSPWVNPQLYTAATQAAE